MQGGPAKRWKHLGASAGMKGRISLHKAHCQAGMHPHRREFAVVVGQCVPMLDPKGPDDQITGLAAGKAEAARQTVITGGRNWNGDLARRSLA